MLKFQNNSNIFPLSVANISFVAIDSTDFAFGINSTKVWLLEIIYTFSKTLGRSLKKRAKYHPLKTNLIIFPCLEVNISFFL